MIHFFFVQQTMTIYKRIYKRIYKTGEGVGTPPVTLFTLPSKEIGVYAIPTATNTFSNTRKIIQNAERATPAPSSAISLPLPNKIKYNMSVLKTVLAVVGTLFGVSFVVAFLVFYTKWRKDTRVRRWNLKGEEWSAHALDEGFYKLVEEELKDSSFSGDHNLRDAIKTCPQWSQNTEPFTFEGETFQYYLELERGFGDCLRRCHTSGVFLLLDRLQPSERVFCLTYCHNESAVSLLRHHPKASQLKIVEIPMFVPYRTLEVLFPGVPTKLSRQVHDHHVRQLVTNYAYFLRRRPQHWAFHEKTAPDCVRSFKRYVIFHRLAGEVRREIPVALSRRIVQAMLKLDNELHVVHLSAKPQKRIIHDAVPDEHQVEQPLINHTRYHFWQDKFPNIYDTIKLFAEAEAAVLTLSALSNAATMYQIPCFLLVPDEPTYENVQRFGRGYFALEYEQEPGKYPHCVFRKFQVSRLQKWRETTWLPDPATSSSSETS